MKHPASFAIAAVMCTPMLRAAPAADSLTVCRSAVESREIRIHRQADGGCRVDYVKDGSTRTLWSARGDPLYCDSRAAELAARLERGGLNCEVGGAGASAAAGKARNERASPAATTRRPVPTDRSELTVAQIGAANQWLQQRVRSLNARQAVSDGPEAKRFSDKPDFLAAADVDADGRTDLVLGWGWASFRCDGTFLTVLLNDATDAQPSYRAAEAELPGNCGAKGWLASVQEAEAQRVVIRLQQRYPGSDNVQQVSASVNHDGRFTFFDPSGRPGSLVAIEKALPLKGEGR